MPEVRQVKRVYRLVENGRDVYAVVTDGPLSLREAGNASSDVKTMMGDIVQYPEFCDVIIEDGVLAVKPQQWLGNYLQRSDVTMSSAESWLEAGNILVYAAGEYMYTLALEDVWPTFDVFKRNMEFDQLMASMGRQFGNIAAALNFITALAPIEAWRAAGAEKPPVKEKSC